MNSKKSIILNCPPLMCWDIFMEGFHRRIQLATDLKKLRKIMTVNNWSPLQVSLDNTLIWQNKVIVITDADVRIVYATENMVDMNGYKPQEVIGKSPKIFQGEATTSAEKKIIKLAVHNRMFFDTIITNYKKDGAIYKCHIEGHPVFDKQGKLTNFVAIENAA